MLLLQARRYPQLSEVMASSMFVARAGLPGSRTKPVVARQVERVSRQALDGGRMGHQPRGCRMVHIAQSQSPVVREKSLTAWPGDQ